MTPYQLTALRHPCLLACEVAHPRFRHRVPAGWLTLTVNAGYEALAHGGPVWHAYIRPTGTHRFIPPDWQALRESLLQVLQGVGALDVAPWEARTDKVLHLRRRLSAAETESAQLAARDVRGTPEASDRVRRLLLAVPDAHKYAMRELGHAVLVGHG